MNIRLWKPFSSIKCWKTLFRRHPVLMAWSRIIKTQRYTQAYTHWHAAFLHYKPTTLLFRSCALPLYPVSRVFCFSFAMFCLVKELFSLCVYIVWPYEHLFDGVRFFKKTIEILFFFLQFLNKYFGFHVPSLSRLLSFFNLNKKISNPLFLLSVNFYLNHPTIHSSIHLSIL